MESKAVIGPCKIGNRSNDVRSINETTNTFVFKTFDVNINWKNYYLDLGFVGRHFLLWPDKNPWLKRHYTISNCMRREARLELLRVGKLFLESDGEITQEELNFDWNCFSTEDMDEVTMTIKNYET